MNTPETDSKAWSDHSEGILHEVVEASFARKLERERDEARAELANLESLMFGGLVQPAPKNALAWRVFDAVMAIKKERDEARQEWGKASMDAAQLLSEKTKIMAERDELQDILRKLLEIIPEPECHDFGHTKEERHAFLEECPVMARYDALIAQAKEALK